MSGPITAVIVYSQCISICFGFVKEEFNQVRVLHFSKAKTEKQFYWFIVYWLLREFISIYLTVRHLLIHKIAEMLLPLSRMWLFEKCGFEGETMMKAKVVTSSGSRLQASPLTRVVFAPAGLSYVLMGQVDDEGRGTVTPSSFTAPYKAPHHKILTTISNQPC